MNVKVEKFPWPTQPLFDRLINLEICAYKYFLAVKNENVFLLLTVIAVENVLFECFLLYDYYSLFTVHCLLITAYCSLKSRIIFLSNIHVKLETEHDEYRESNYPYDAVNPVDGIF